MSTDNVTPIRPGSEPAVSATSDIRNAIDDHLAHARAIVDLVYICHVEDALEKLDNDTVGWALTAVTERLGEVADGVGKLADLACVREEAPQP